MDFKISKLDTGEIQIKFLKIAEDQDGNVVNIVHDTAIISLEHAEQQVVNYQNAILKDQIELEKWQGIVAEINKTNETLK